MRAALTARKRAVVLWALLSLFCLRVFGQLLVAIAGAGFLPPMEKWQSGLLPYPALVVSQIVIIVVLARVCIDFTHGHGYFAYPKARLGRGLLIFGLLYFAGMIVRYAVRMALYPEERWVGGCIPIFFHLILATFVLIVAAHHRRAAQ